MREENRIRTVEKIIQEYRFDKPFSRYLGEYFKQNPQMGSKDRKESSNLAYCYFRLGKALHELSFEERLAVGGFLASSVTSPALLYLYEKFSFIQPAADLDSRISFIQSRYPEFNLSSIIPFEENLCTWVEKEQFFKSFLIQPDVFIRIRKNKVETVIKELKQKDLDYIQISATCAAFPNSTALNQLISYNQGMFEIQDLSSQKTASIFQPGKEEYWWDCCAASGGKSLLLAENEPSVKILATDIRESILKNYTERLQKSHFKRFSTQIADLSNDHVITEKFDGIIADVPCSGSGTWSRTPEMMHTFKKEEIQKFSELQKKIVSNLIPQLRQGKPLIYITCSAFREENEEVVEFIEQNFGLKTESVLNLKGYKDKADTMFAARMIRP